MNKKGWAMPELIGGVILGIIIFIGILYLYYTYFGGYGAVIDKETCHQSVILRSTFNAGSIQAGKKYIPLKCETEKICVSKSGDNCDAAGFENPDKKKNPITKVNVGKKDTKQVLMETLATAIYECHWMLGEGKLNFMPNIFWEKKYCLMCARIALDKKAREEVAAIGYPELLRYMEKKKTKEGINYLKFIYEKEKFEEMEEGLKNRVEEYNKEAEKSDSGLEKLNSIEQLGIDFSANDGVAITAQLIPYTAKGSAFLSSAVALVTGIVAGGIIILSGGLAAPAGIALVIGAKAALIVLGAKATIVGVTATYISFSATHFVTQPDGSVYISPGVYNYNVEALKSMECSSFETAP